MRINAVGRNPLLFDIAVLFALASTVNAAEIPCRRHGRCSSPLGLHRDDGERRVLLHRVTACTGCPSHAPSRRVKEEIWSHRDAVLN